ncbi:hypothetical protein NPX13_g11196 [Xylaria arbuscula]|uniref:Uncharacterized protein n=1 Tax=Xylaria arbuscula TaxID=114810 RepID=A0A9W8TG34_9PEZI|nr:hypothetical protein NPX13_g11196 [Xylaria arbuscula]
MLCQICHKGLEGIHDPSKTNRLGLRSDVLSCDPFSQGDSNKDRPEPLELESYVFGHHKTLASFQHSIAQGCVMCNRFGPKDADIDYNELFERLGYFSVFTVSLSPGQSQLKMSVHYGNTIGSFVLIPYSENDPDIIQTLPASTKDKETWTTIQIWLNRCDEKHTFCQPSPNGTLPNWLLQLRNPLMPNASSLWRARPQNPTDQFEEADLP